MRWGPFGTLMWRGLTSICHSAVGIKRAAANCACGGILTPAAGTRLQF